MDQEVVDNKITKDLAHSENIPALELPSFNIVTTLSRYDLEYIENEVIPFSILKNIENKFSDFSEVWVEHFEGLEKRQVSNSEKLEFNFFHLYSNNLNYRNSLITNTYHSKDNYKIKVSESRKELILTDGEVIKQDKIEIKSSDDFFTENYQDIQVFNPTYVVILERSKKTSPYGRWGHHDTLKIYMKDRMKLDYLRLYIGSKF